MTVVSQRTLRSILFYPLKFQISSYIITRFAHYLGILNYLHGNQTLNLQITHFYGYKFSIFAFKLITMTVPNAFIIFLFAFSGITGWLMFRTPTSIEVTNTGTTTDPAQEPEKVAPPIKKPQPVETAAVPKITPPAPEEDIYSQLDKTILPLLDLSNVTLAEAIGFLEFRGREITANQSPPAKSLHIKPHQADQETLYASMDGSARPPVFTLYAENITFTEALNLICEKADCYWEADEYQVTVFPNEVDK